MASTEPSGNQEETQFYSKNKGLVILESSEWRKFRFWSLGGYPRIHTRSVLISLIKASSQQILENFWKVRWCSCMLREDGFAKNRCRKIDRCPVWQLSSNNSTWLACNFQGCNCCQPKSGRRWKWKPVPKKIVFSTLGKTWFIFVQTAQDFMLRNVAVNSETLK